MLFLYLNFCIIYVFVLDSVFLISHITCELFSLCTFRMNVVEGAWQPEFHSLPVIVVQMSNKGTYKELKLRFIPDSSSWRH